MSKVTNKQIAQFREVGALWMKRLKDKDRTKLDYAVEKHVKNLKAKHELYLDKQADLRAEHASVDKDTKVLLKDEAGNFKYEPTKLIALRKALRDLDNKEVEDFKPHEVDPSELPDSLEIEFLGGDGNTHVLTDYDVRQAFEGVVIAELTEK